MIKIENSREFQNIVDNLKDGKFSEALEKTKQISKIYSNENIVSKLFASIYFNLGQWENSIKYFKKTLLFEKEKFKTYTNLGVALFKLGKINDSINAFKDSIKDNKNFFLAHNNIGISYLEIGKLDEAINHFVISLKLNHNDRNAKSNIINIFNIKKPKNISHPLIELNNKIRNIRYDKEIDSIFTDQKIKIILEKANEFLNKFDEKLFSNETQIFRKNSNNLNCNRHFKVFNEFKIIPKFCFSCFKVQINVKNVADLIKLHFLFDKLKLKKNNTRKCMIEIRKEIKGNYKGYIYCNGVNEAEIIMEDIQNKLINQKIVNFKITIKHGCSEFYVPYPQFEKVSFNNEEVMKYKEEWTDKEDYIDSLEPQRLKIDKKIYFQSLNGINLSDILVINNWIDYAETIGDYSYKKLLKKKIQSSRINDLLKNQLKFRQEEILN